MSSTRIMISSITHAQMGRDILMEEGIRSSIERTPKTNDPYGCGYSLKVQGDTGRAVRLLKEAGATEVHVRSASPMVTWPCFYGIDTADQDQLIAANMTLEEIRDHIGADSVGFLSLEGLMACVPEGVGYCKACFNGEYPVAIPRTFYEEKFLPGYEPNNLNPVSAESKMNLEDVLNLEEKEN